jgi:hypothetical protein
MIVILPTTTGYSVGVVPLRNEKAKKKALTGKAHQLPGRTLAEHLARIRKWMRLSKRYAN